MTLGDRLRERARYRQTDRDRDRETERAANETFYSIRAI